MNFIKILQVLLKEVERDDTGFGRQLTAILGSENRLDKVKSINFSNFNYSW